MRTRREIFPKLSVFLGPALALGQRGSLRLNVPFQHAADRGSLLIRARINRRPALLIVDTGSTHTIVRPALLGMKSSEVSPSRGGAGIVGDAVGREVAFELGDQLWPRRRVSVMDLSQALAAYQEPVDGLLGLDFFLEFSQVLINLKERLVTFIR
jgi:aspartyl protease